jgi:hypothetical protein
LGRSIDIKFDHHTKQNEKDIIQLVVSGIQKHLNRNSSRKCDAQQEVSTTLLSRVSTLFCLLSCAFNKDHWSIFFSGGRPTAFASFDFLDQQ